MSTLCGNGCQEGGSDLSAVIFLLETDGCIQHHLTGKKKRQKGRGAGNRWNSAEQFWPTRDQHPNQPQRLALLFGTGCQCFILRIIGNLQTMEAEGRGSGQPQRSQLSEAQRAWAQDTKLPGHGGLETTSEETAACVFPPHLGSVDKRNHTLEIFFSLHQLTSKALTA